MTEVFIKQPLALPGSAKKNSLHYLAEALALPGSALQRALLLISSRKLNKSSNSGSMDSLDLFWIYFTYLWSDCWWPNTCSAREQRVRDWDDSEKPDKRPLALYSSLYLLQTEHILLGSFVVVTEFINVAVTPPSEPQARAATHITWQMAGAARELIAAHAAPLVQLTDQCQAARPAASTRARASRPSTLVGKGPLPRRRHTA